jgi:hypothetical protein
MPFQTLMNAGVEKRLIRKGPPSRWRKSRKRGRIEGTATRPL